jgi:hypothetical protein
MTRLSPDHGEVDYGGVSTVRTRVLDAASDVTEAAYDLFYDTAFSGWHHMKQLKGAVDRLVVEIGEAGSEQQRAEKAEIERWQR